MQSPSLLFADTVRRLGDQARLEGHVVPVFRSPPRVLGVDRSVQRRRDGGMTVSIRIRNRPWPAVLADAIEGIVVANDLSGAAAARCRADLWPVALAAETAVA